ncbi:MAG: sigma-70 family RNA polymerase sigma factor [Acidimicrobiia bacterium]
MNSDVFERVLGAAQEAENWAWARLYEWLAPQLGGYFRMRGFPQPDDLVGDTFLQLARGLHRFRGDVKSFKSWAFMIAHNRISNERRRLARRPLTLVGDFGSLEVRTSPSAEDSVLSQFEEESVLSLLSRLTDDQRNVVALRVMAGFSVEEAAEILGKTAGSVKQLQRRALESLRRELIEP